MSKVEFGGTILPEKLNKSRREQQETERRSEFGGNVFHVSGVGNVF